MTHQDAKTNSLTALLEREGIPQARARAIAEEVFRQHAGSEPGSVYGDVDSLGIARIWERATFAGVRAMTLHIEAQARALADDDGLLTVSVQHSEKWPEWDDDQDARASGMAGLIAGWSEVDDMAHGEECPDVWQPSAEMQEAQARARAKGLN